MEKQIIRISQDVPCDMCDEEKLTIEFNNGQRDFRCCKKCLKKALRRLNKRIIFGI